MIPKGYFILSLIFIACCIVGTVNYTAEKERSLIKYKKRKTQLQAAAILADYGFISAKLNISRLTMQSNLVEALTKNNKTNRNKLNSNSNKNRK